MSLTDFPGGRDGWHITSGTYPNPNVQDLLADVRKGTGRMTCATLGKGTGWSPLLPLSR